jgi:hypothetical protein
VSAAAFTERAAAALRAAHPTAVVEVVRELVLRVRGPDGREAVARLDNLHAEAGQPGVPEARVLARLVGSAAAALSPPTGSLDRILPLVRHVDHVTRMWATRPGAPRLPACPLAGPLWCCYGFDLPDALQVVSREAADRLALTDDRLHAVALDNLRRTLSPALHGDGPVWQVASGGTWDAAWLLDDALWDTLPVPGPHAVAVPARDVLLVTGVGVAGGVEALQALAARVLREVDHPLWDGVLVRDSGRWVVG